MFYIVIIAFVVILDLATKNIAIRKTNGTSKEIFKKKLYITIAKNKGAFYNVLSSRPWLVKILSGTSIAITFAYLFSLYKSNGTKLEKTGLSLLIGGGLGNFIDRITKGYVTDFIYVKWKKAPVFNFADLFILFGILMYLVAFVKQIKLKQ